MYLRERYAENADALFGIMASSKDKELVRFGISNDYKQPSGSKWEGGTATVTEALCRADS